MKKSTHLFLAFLSLLFLLGCSTRHYPSVYVRPASCSHDFQYASAESLGALLQFADKMQKPIFMNFYSPWIETCTRMENQVLTNDDLAMYFNSHFINFKANMGEPGPGPMLADMYGVTKFPTYLFIDGKGKVMRRQEGYANASQLMEMGIYLNKAVEKEWISMGTH